MDHQPVSIDVHVKEPTMLSRLLECDMYIEKVVLRTRQKRYYIVSNVSLSIITMLNYLTTGCNSTLSRSVPALNPAGTMRCLAP